MILTKDMFGSGKRSAIRCVETGEEWASITTLCKQFDMNVRSAYTTMSTKKMIGALHFEYITK